MVDLTEEHITGLFADLRAGELHRIRPPGVAASRSTVRRRRTTRIVTAGVSAAAGVAAVGMAGILPGGDDRREPAHVPLGAAALMAFQNAAATRIGANPLSQPARKLSGQVPLTAERRESHRVVAGSYELTLSCVGTGSATVAFRDSGMRNSVGPAPADMRLISSVVVPCQASAQVQTTTITVARDNLYIDVAPDHVAAGAAGFAYRADLTQQSTEQLRMSAGEALGLTAPKLAQSTHYLSGLVKARQAPVGDGKYRLRVACAGAGSVYVAVTLSLPGGFTSSTAEDVPCRLPASTGGIRFAATNNSAAIPVTVSMMPNTAATRQAAVALQIVPE